MDELAETGVGSCDAHEGGGDAGEHGEEEDDEGRVPKAHAKRQGRQQAGGEAGSRFSIFDGVVYVGTESYGSRFKRQVKKTVNMLLYWVLVRYSSGTGLIPFSSTPASSSLWYHLGLFSG